MFNLLPDSLKDKIKDDYKSRRLVVVLLFIIFLQIIFLVFIFPSWLTSVYRENDALLQTEKMNKSDLTINASSTANMIKSLNQKLVVLNTYLEYPKLTPIIENIISNKTRYVSINEVYFVSNSSTTATVSIGGVSLTRESLVSFKKDIENSGYFKNIDLPISNLAKEKNIRFSMTMTVFKK